MMRFRFKHILQHPLFFPIFMSILYVAVNIILVINHEPWQGDANAWQIAKTINVNNVWEVLQAEPHSILWYLLVAPFAKLGLPFITAGIVSLIIMTLAVFLFARYALFPK